MVSTSHLKRSLSKKYSSNSNNGRAASWEQPHGPRILQRTYLELGELDRSPGPSTFVHGGKQDSMSDSLRNEEHTRHESSQCSDIEREAVDGQILKTVRLERSSF